MSTSQKHTSHPTQKLYCCSAPCGGQTGCWYGSFYIGYLVPSNGNTFEFYEVPQAATQAQKEVSANGLDFKESPPCDNAVSPDGHNVMPENIEINKKDNIIPKVAFRMSGFFSNAASSASE